jgi:hypothetical protein
MIKKDNNRPTKIATIVGTNFFVFFDKTMQEKIK